jgi:hypothetical protein
VEQVSTEMFRKEYAEVFSGTEEVNILHRQRLDAHLVKERRQANVGRIFLPVVGI